MRSAAHQQVERNTYAAIDLKPNERAGASGELELEPLAVALLGIGNAGGVKRSPSKTETVLGAPSSPVSHARASQPSPYLCHCVQLDPTAHPAHSYPEGHGALSMAVLKHV